MRKRWKFTIGSVIVAAMAGAVFSFTGCTIFGCKNQVAQITINSFEECSDAGYLVVPSDPPRCVIDKYHIFTQDPEFIRVATPEPFEIVASPLLISGQARATNNTVFYRLQTNNQLVLDEGSFSGNSPDHGRWGEVSIEIFFDIPEVPSGTLFLFEQGQSWDDEKAISIPINFSSGTSFKSPGPDTDIESSFSSAPFDPLQELQTISIPNNITLDVPFTPQAPFADWSEPYNEACEEASILMVDFYLKDLPLSRAKADLEIVRQVNWQTNQGYTVDIDSEELVVIAQEYFGHRATRYLDDDVTVENIKRLLAGGYPVIIPAAGQKLGNPNFRGAGPPYHMLVITGYTADSFITNDPGTRNGEDFEYSYDTIVDAIHDWTGAKQTIEEGRKAIVVLGKSQ